MIRGQGIDPLTTPAYHKFKLFTRLRRWVIGYFILHTFIIISQVLAMNLGSACCCSIWELVQLAITSAIGWLFKSGSGSNVYLDREEHLPCSRRSHTWSRHTRCRSAGMTTQTLSSQRTARWRPWAGQRRAGRLGDSGLIFAHSVAGGDAGAAAARATADDRNLPRAAAARRRTNSHAANGGARTGAAGLWCSSRRGDPRPAPSRGTVTRVGERVSVLGGCVCFRSGTG